MKTFTALLVAVAACAALACGGTSEPEPTTASTTSGDTPADTVDEEPAADEPPAAGVTVTRLSGSDTAPATSGNEPTSATARADGGSIVLTLTNFIYHCSPPPTFAARMEGDVLVVQAQPPTGPGTRCVGPHSAVLRVDGVSAGAHPVSIRDMHGQEVATTEATIGE